MDRYLQKLHSITFGEENQDLSGETYSTLLPKLRQKSYSDVTANGLQYVDLVLEGGGMLGFALLGYTYVLEECGLRFWSIAGTSAGAITAGLLAGIAPKDRARSTQVLKHLATLNTGTFVDGSEKTSQFVNTVQRQGFSFETAKQAARPKLWELLGNFKDGVQWHDFFAQEWKTAWNRLGINPGNQFLNWVEQIFAEAGITTNAQLQQRLEFIPPGLEHLAPAMGPARLAVIAADITTQTKVQFPQDAKLYWAAPDQVSPALFIRASMAVPLFFEPLRVQGIPEIQNHAREWKLKGYDGPTPPEVLLVDGGIVSNFPINVFHSPQVPRCPTFGAKLGRDGDRATIVRDPKDLLAACFDQARNSLDRDFLEKNADYSHLVSFIDTGGHGWLDFAMKEEAKIDLFARGAREALCFLHKFDWAAYKQIRQELFAALSAVPTPPAAATPGETVLPTAVGLG